MEIENPRKLGHSYKNDQQSRVILYILLSLKARGFPRPFEYLLSKRSSSFKV